MCRVLCCVLTCCVLCVVCCVLCVFALAGRSGTLTRLVAGGRSLPRRPGVVEVNRVLQLPVVLVAVCCVSGHAIARLFYIYYLGVRVFVFITCDATSIRPRPNRVHNSGRCLAAAACFLCDLFILAQSIVVLVVAAMCAEGGGGVFLCRAWP